MLDALNDGVTYGQIHNIHVLLRGGFIYTWTIVYSVGIVY
jgi:hypothetical protein